MRKTMPWLLIPCLVATLAMAASPPSPTRNLTRAIEAQKNLSLERPNDAVVLNDLGNLLKMGGKLEEAEEAYRKAIEVAPQKVSAHYNLGLLLQQLGRRDKALKEFREVVELDPEFAWAHYQIGTVLEAKGNDSQALKAYARAFSINPELAFFEVNPQVIETQLLTEALLASYREVAARPQAPNTYADPSHVTSLLLASPATAREEPPAEAEAASTTERPATGSLSRASLSSSGRESGGSRAETGSASPRVLTANELDGRQVGQIGAAVGGAPQRGGSRPRQGGYGGGTRGGSANSGGGYTWSKGATETQGGTRAGQTRPGAGSRPTIVQPSFIAPGAPGALPQNPAQPGGGASGFGAGGFRPGTNSTGSLENSLVREDAWG